MARVLIIGGGGFIGGFIARESLRRGHETWVAVRESTSRQWLDDPHIRLLNLTYDSPEALCRELSEALPQGECWDYVVYNLGATKVIKYSDFTRINCGYLRAVVDALRGADKMPKRLLYISTMGVLEPDESRVPAFDEHSLIGPTTKYGSSKAKAEAYLAAQPDVPWIALRPTGVYGPHEQDYLMMVKLIERGVDIKVGFKPQQLTFIYVTDLVDAIFEALDKAPLRKAYIVSEDKAYSPAEFRHLVANALGRKRVVTITLPLWIVKAVCDLAEKWALASLKPSILNADKFKIMRQRNWTADISAARRDFGFSPKVSLSQGIEATVKSYRASL